MDRQWNCSSWTGLLLAAHPAACCYPGWLGNDTQRQRGSAHGHVRSDAGSRFWMKTRCSQSGTFVRSVMPSGADLKLPLSYFFICRTEGQFGDQSVFLHLCRFLWTYGALSCLNGDEVLWVIRYEAVTQRSMNERPLLLCFSPFSALSFLSFLCLSPLVEMPPPKSN